MIAAGHIGANASSRLHRGEGRHHNSIQAKTTASATPHPMASKNLALSDIRISFAFSPRSNHSTQRGCHDREVSRSRIPSALCGHPADRFAACLLFRASLLSLTAPTVVATNSVARLTHREGV